MRKLILLLVVAVLSLPAFAAEKGEIYLGPVLGYHFFDGEHGLDDSWEGGLRLGRFYSDTFAFEVEGDYTSTDYDKGGDESATSLSVHGVKFFDLTSYYKPFVFAGLGGMFSADDMASLVVGIGARTIVNDKFSIDFRIKDMIHSEGRNDIIPSIALNIHFGGKKIAYAPAPAPAAKAEEKPAAPAEEEKPAAATQERKAAHAVAVADADGDGVADDMDKCPTTPKGYPVNTDGCTPDSDGDGVYDFEDRCPDTIRGVTVNSAGCFTAKTLSVNFGTDSSKIDERFLEDVTVFADFMKKNPPIKVEVQGHTDSRGTNDHNMKLSQKRAEAVADMLIKKFGVPADRVSAVGYGEEKPLVPNTSKENMFKNRRIETVVK